MHDLPVNGCGIAPETFMFLDFFNLFYFVTFCVCERFYAVSAKTAAGMT